MPVNRSLPRNGRGVLKGIGTELQKLIEQNIAMGYSVEKVCRDFGISRQQYDAILQYMSEE